MSHRLQVLIPEELDKQLRRAAKRAHTSKGQFVRQAIEDALQRTSRASADYDPVAELAKLNAPTCDVKEMIAEIESRYDEGLR